ncbi:MAG: hypothetical protein GY854_18595 [Deltaproteobacteria bacterium]|nr:hypothetical protein [Deltaproteobacteria bacterium]
MKTLSLSFLLVVFAYLLVSCGEDPDEVEETEFKCEDVGGECTSSQSTMCANEYEPYTDRDWVKSDCFGHCCVPAPSSPCSESEDNVNCIPGDGCSGHWNTVEGNLYCEEGRSCCYWSGK